MTFFTHKVSFWTDNRRLGEFSKSFFFLFGGGEGANLSPKNSTGSSARAVLVKLTLNLHGKTNRYPTQLRVFVGVIHFKMRAITTKKEGDFLVIALIFCDCGNNC